MCNIQGYTNKCEVFPEAGYLTMTSSNENIFRVTGHLCGEFTGPGEFPTQRPVTRSFDVLFDLRLNKRLIKQPWGWWFETPSWSLWRQCNVWLGIRPRPGHHKSLMQVSYCASMEVIIVKAGFYYIFNKFECFLCWSTFISTITRQNDTLWTSSALTLLSVYVIQYK